MGCLMKMMLQQSRPLEPKPLAQRGLAAVVPTSPVTKPLTAILQWGAPSEMALPVFVLRRRKRSSNS